jgi:gas vesicle protein
MSENGYDEIEETDDSSNKIGWFLVGFLVGTAGAVLFAPRSGKTTRRFIAKKTRQGRRAVEASTHDLMGRGREFVERGKHIVDDAGDLFERGRKLVRG